MAILRIAVYRQWPRQRYQLFDMIREIREHNLDADVDESMGGSSRNRPFVRLEPPRSYDARRPFPLAGGARPWWFIALPTQ